MEILKSALLVITMVPVTVFLTMMLLYIFASIFKLVSK